MTPENYDVYQEAKLMFQNQKYGDALDFIEDNMDRSDPDCDTYVQYLEGECFMKVNDPYMAAECYKAAYLAAMRPKEAITT